MNFPIVTIDIVDDSGRPVSLHPPSEEIGPVPIPRLILLRLSAGETMEVCEGRVFWGGPSKGAHAGEGSGRFRIRAIYDSRPDYEAAGIEWPDRLFRERLVSDWVEFTVEP